LNASLRQIDASFGSFDAYARNPKGLGLDDAALSALRSELLE
jgi:hypothetical protein